MRDLKNFFGSIFINRTELRKSGIDYPIKVEYYKITDENYNIRKKKQIYGIQVIKTEYKEKIGIEQSKIENITNDEKEINQILNLIKENSVTPIGLEDVVKDIKTMQGLQIVRN